MRFIATPNGFETVEEASESRATHPVRLVTISSRFGEPGGTRETAYASIEDALTDLEYSGQYFDDIALVEIEGAAPRDLGFETAY